MERDLDSFLAVLLRVRRFSFPVLCVRIFMHALVYSNYWNWCVSVCVGVGSRMCGRGGGILPHRLRVFYGIYIWCLGEGGAGRGGGLQYIFIKFSVRFEFFGV